MHVPSHYRNGASKQAKESQVQRKGLQEQGSSGSRDSERAVREKRQHNRRAKKYRDAVLSAREQHRRRARRQRAKRDRNSETEAEEEEGARKRAGTRDRGERERSRKESKGGELGKREEEQEEKQKGLWKQ